MRVPAPPLHPHGERCGASSAPSFADADVVVLTDIYAAGEQPIPGVTGKLLVDAVLDAHPWSGWPGCRAASDVRRATSAAELRPGDLCLTVGAGDITTWPDDVLAAVGDGGR